MVRQEMQKSTAVYEHDAQFYDVGRLSKELDIICPQFESLDVGYLDTWDDEAGSEVQRLAVFVHYNGELSKDEKHTIEELLKIEVPYEEISYVKSEK